MWIAAWRAHTHMWLQMLAPRVTPMRALFSRAHVTRSSLRSRMQRSSRNSRASLTPEGAIYAVVGANLAVFGAWNYASWQARGGDGRTTKFMLRNFTSSEENIRAGRWWTLLTASISHYSTSHLALNMLGFVFTAPPIARAIGARRLLTLYCGAGTAGAISSIVWPHISGSRRTQRTLGASGAVYGILSTFACLNPNATFLLFFVVPVPAWMCVAGLLAWDTYSALNPRQGDHTDSPGHVGGLLAGVAFSRFLPLL